VPSSSSLQHDHEFERGLVFETAERQEKTRKKLRGRLGEVDLLPKKKTVIFRVFVDCDMRGKPHSMVSTGWQPYGQLKLCALAEHACRVGWLVLQWKGEVGPPPRVKKIKNSDF